jgi:hypothetical protein
LLSPGTRFDGRQRASLAAVCALASSLPAHAAAHSGFAFGLHPLIDDGVLVAGGTDFGLLTLDDGVPTWTCAATAPLPPEWWRLLPDGRIVVGTAGGTVATADGGCSFSPLDGPIGAAYARFVADDPLDPTHLFATSPGASPPASLWESSDGGATWLPRPLPGGYAGRIVALGGRSIAVEIDGADADSIARSDDGGDSWVSTVLGGWFEPKLLAFEPPPAAGDDDSGDDDSAASREGTLWISALSPDGYPSMLALSPSLSAAPVVRRQFRGSVGAFVPWQGGYALIEGWDGFVLWDGEYAVWDDDRGVVRDMNGLPMRCLRIVDGTLWGCGGAPLHGMFGRLDGEVWTDLLWFPDIVRRECPAGTPGATDCDDSWAQLHPDAGDDDSAPADDDFTVGDDDTAASQGDCGCPGPGGVGWIAVFFLRPRRHRACTSPSAG